MRTPFLHILCATFLTLAGGHVAPANADIILDTFDEGGTFHPTDNAGAAKASGQNPVPTAIRAAAQFRVVGGDYALSAITFPMNFQNTLPADFLRVRLTEDVDDAPGPTIEVLCENDPIWPPYTPSFSTTTTVLSTLQPVLREGRAYWIVTEPTDFIIGERIDYRWYVNVSGATVRMLHQWAEAALPLDPWYGPPFDWNLAVRIEGKRWVAAVGEDRLPEMIELGIPRPNPTRSGASFDLRLATSCVVRCEILDLTGRRVAFLLNDRQSSAGTRSLQWDGKDTNGRSVAPGIYTVRVLADGGEARRRVVVIL